jgi:arylsulfatase
VGLAVPGPAQARGAPFPFTGALRTVTVDLSGDLITDTESEMRMAMARQ